MRLDVLDCGDNRVQRYDDVEPNPLVVPPPYLKVQFQGHLRMADMSAQPRAHDRRVSNEDAVPGCRQGTLRCIRIALHGPVLVDRSPTRYAAQRRKRLHLYRWKR